jgi:hypothetical protein
MSLYRWAELKRETGVSLYRCAELECETGVSLYKRVVLEWVSLPFVVLVK